MRPIAPSIAPRRTAPPSGPLLAAGLAAASVVALPGGAAAQDAAELDVVHWLTAGSEGAAIQVLADALEARGVTWVDSAAPGGGADARAILMSRIAGGDPPGASFAALGPEAVDLGEGGALRDVREVAEANGLDDVVPVMVDISTGEDGALYAVPIGLETQNLMFRSPAAFEKAGVEAPDTWQAFLDAAPKLQEADVIPIAVGAQGWQLGILFTSVLVGTGGPEAYRRAFVEHDAEAAAGDATIEAFGVMRELASLADAGAANRAWNDTLNLVADGSAAFQVMGSWAGAELANMGLEQGTAWDCALAPGNETVVVEGAGFMFPEPSSDEVREAQDAFVQVLLDPKVEADFGALKGSVPPSTAADTSGMSSCTKLVADALEADPDAALPTISASISPDGWGQVQDMLANFWSDPSMTAEAAAQQFSEIVSGEQ